MALVVLAALLVAVTVAPCDWAALGVVSIREEPEPTWCSDYSGTSQEVCETKVINNEVLDNPRPGYRYCRYVNTFHSRSVSPGYWLNSWMLAAPSTSDTCGECAAGARNERR